MDSNVTAVNGMSNNQDCHVYLLLSTRLQPPGTTRPLIHMHVSVDSENQRFFTSKADVEM